MGRLFGVLHSYAQLYRLEIFEIKFPFPYMYAPGGILRGSPAWYLALYATHGPDWHAPPTFEVEALAFQLFFLSYFIHFLRPDSQSFPTRRVSDDNDSPTLITTSKICSNNNLNTTSNI